MHDLNEYNLAELALKPVQSLFRAISLNYPRIRQFFGAPKVELSEGWVVQGLSCPRFSLPSWVVRGLSFPRWRWPRLNYPQVGLSAGWVVRRLGCPGLRCPEVELSGGGDVQGWDVRRWIVRVEMSEVVLSDHRSTLVYIGSSRSFLV